jgi:hypothetical protein
MANGSTAPASTTTFTVGFIEVEGYNPSSVSIAGALPTSRNYALPVIVEGTAAVSGTVTASNTVGSVAHDGVDAGNPVKVGAKAYSTNPVKVASGDRTDLIADLQGKLISVGSIRDLKANQVTTITASTTETTIVTAAGASVFADLYGLIVTNTSATAVNVAIKDVTAGTTRLNIAVPAGDTRGFMLPESGGIKQSTANSAWTATVSASVTSIVITALTVNNL